MAHQFGKFSRQVRVKTCRFPEDEIEKTISEGPGRLGQLIAQAGNQLPEAFPDTVAGPIFAGLKMHGRNQLAHLSLKRRDGHGR